MSRVERAPQNRMNTEATQQRNAKEPAKRGARRPLRLWFLVAVCVLQAGAISLAVALTFSEARSGAARVVGTPTGELAMVGGAVMTAYLAAAVALYLRQTWARAMTATLFALTILATVGVVLTPGEAARSTNERWMDLAAVSPMLVLQGAAFALLVLSRRERLFGR